MTNRIEWEAEVVPDLSRYETYEAAISNVDYEVPEQFNVARGILAPNVESTDRTALSVETEQQETETYTFDELDERSGRLARGLRERGVERGDRVGLVAAQRVETALVHLATYKIGGVVVPLSPLYGPEGLQSRISGSECKVIISQAAQLPQVEETTSKVSSVETVVGIGAEPDRIDSASVAEFDDVFGSTGVPTVETAAVDPAVILYTSGTTGLPKGVTHGHHFLFTMLSFFQMGWEAFWSDSDPRFYTPASWAWSGGLNNVLWPAWHYGFPVVAHEKSRFEAEDQLRILDKYEVTHAQLMPTMLKKIAQVDGSGYDVSSVETVITGGEPVSTDLYELVDEMFDGATLHEMYGTTEVLAATVHCSRWFEPKPGSMGKPIPGNAVEIIDESGSILPPGEEGIIAVKNENGNTFSEYWGDPEQTAAVHYDGWVDTGDVGHKDENGYFWFKARADDVIISSGYRISPKELEDHLHRHDAVANVAVIGIDHETRGEIPKAFIELEAGRTPDEAMKEEIQRHAKDGLAKYQYPREIEFLDALPTTATDKIKRGDLRKREDG